MCEDEERPGGRLGSISQGEHNMYEVMTVAWGLHINFFRMENWSSEVMLRFNHVSGTPKEEILIPNFLSTYNMHV